MSLPTNNDNNTDILKLNEVEVEKIEYAKEIKENRQNNKSKKISLIVFDDLDDKIKNAFYMKISNNPEELKKYIFDITYKLLYKFEKSIGNKNINAKQDFRHEYSQFISYITQHKNNWYNSTITKIKKKHKHVLQYKDEFYADLTYEEFSKILLEQTKKWRDDPKTFICEYPLYKYITHAYSINSSMRYDIGEYVYKNVSDSLLSSMVFRTFDFLMDSFSPSTKKLPKYKVINIIDNETKENRKVFINENIDSTNKEGFFIDDYADELKDNLSILDMDFDNLSLSDIKMIIKNNRYMFDNLDEDDLSLISVVLDNIDSFFYVNRQIIITEKETLETLGKKVTTDTRRWLRKRISRLAKKKIFSIKENEEDEGSNKILEYSIFQSVELDYNTNKKNSHLKSIKIVISEHIYNAILKEDTINVYKSEFLKMRYSNLPKTVLLIYQIQLLRISAYLMNNDYIEIRDSFFIDILKLNTKSISKVHESITNYLNEFKKNKVMVQEFNYDYDKDLWYIKFIKLTNKDLVTLVNQRKDYKKLVKPKNLLLQD